MSVRILSCSNSPPLPGKNSVQPNFSVNGRISNLEFLLLEQAMKPRPCRRFVLSHLLAKANYLPKNTSIFNVTVLFRWRDLTLPVQTPHPSQARFKFSTLRAPKKIICSLVVLEERGWGRGSGWSSYYTTYFQINSVFSNRSSYVF